MAKFWCTAGAEAERASGLDCRVVGWERGSTSSWVGLSDRWTRIQAKSCQAIKPTNFDRFKQGFVQEDKNSTEETRIGETGENDNSSLYEPNVAFDRKIPKWVDINNVSIL